MAGVYSEDCAVELARFVRERVCEGGYIRITRSPKGGYVVNVGGGRVALHVRVHGVDLEAACRAAQNAMEVE